MNDPDHISSSGNGSHRVHLCPRCGWPFPNSQPSKRHRNAHKKVCGTIEGYNLLPSVSGESTHPAACGHDHLSDEDQKSSNVVESKSKDKSISGIGSVSNRSTDEVFSDAALEFQHSEFSPGNEDRAEKNNSRSVVVDDILDKDLSGTLSLKDCTDANIVESPRTSTDGRQMQYLDVQHSIPNLSWTAPKCQNLVLDSTEEFLHVPIDDRSGSAQDLAPFKPEMQINEPKESKRLHAVDTAAESSPVSGKETEGKANNESLLNINVVDESIPGEHADQTSEAKSEANKGVEITSAAVMTDGVNKAKQEFTGGLATNISVSKGETVQKEAYQKGDDGTISERNVGNVTVLNDEHGETRSRTVFTSEQREDSLGAENDVQSKEEGNDILAPSNHTTDLPSESVSAERNGDAANTLQVKKDVLEDNLKQKDNESRIETKEALDEEDATIKNVGLDSSEVEKGPNVCSLGEQEHHDISGDLQQMDISGGGLKVSPDLNSMAPVDSEVNQPGNVISTTDFHNLVKAGNELHDLAGSGNNKGVPHKDYREVTLTSPESGSLPETEVNQPGNVISTADVSNLVKAGNELHHLAGSGNNKGVPQKDYREVTVASPESGSLPETEAGSSKEKHNETIMGSRGDVNAHKTSISTESDHGRETEVAKSVEDSMKEESLQSPIDVVPPLQSSAAVEDDHSEKSEGIASKCSTVSLQGDLGNSFAKSQLDTTVADFSMESSSQADSLEGNWGSVSVLSMLSDNPAVVDAEASPSLDLQASVEAETTRNASGGHHSDKSDIFKPPSFLRLVEGGARNQKTANSETQLDPQQSKAAPMQAGWSPSLANVCHESSGRDKNWNMKQQAHLKNRLVEATIEAKPKSSPYPNENPAFLVKKNGRLVNDDGTQATTVGAVLVSEANVDEGDKIQAATKWNPARYPADIKRERQKVKSRPYWAQFVCCFSGN